MGTPGPARVLTSLCASLSPVLRPPACNVLGLQETRGKKNLGALEVWQLGHGGLHARRHQPGSQEGRAAGFHEWEAALGWWIRVGGCRSRPQPTGWAILACRLWWAMRWARCLKLLSHSPQPKGRSPVCTRRWSSR